MIEKNSKNSFFRKVAFGLSPNQDLPSDPLKWAQQQVENVPQISWPDKIPDQQELLDQFSNQRVGEELIREKYGDDPKAYEKAREDLNYATGHNFYENLELNIRHHAALHGKSPVFERLVWFWGNHFAGLDKDGLADSGLTGEYHRRVIRENLNKSFVDLTVAATTSYVMIKSLDNSESVGPNSKWGKWQRQNGELATVNENHARELLELHTVSPSAQYTQKDVIALSYIMAGWEVPWTKKRHSGNRVKFRWEKHEPGNHKVFEKIYKQRGLSPKSKLLEVIPDLCRHPACKKFIAFKLCRHFICDEPTYEMMEPIIKAWTVTDGHLPSVHKALLAVAYEYAAKTTKFQSPEVWLAQISNMFAFDHTTDASLMAYDFKSKPNVNQKKLRQILRQLGHDPFRPKQPNGWPDTEIEWVSPELILRRFIIAERLAKLVYIEQKNKQSRKDPFGLIDGNNRLDLAQIIHKNCDHGQSILNKFADIDSLFGFTTEQSKKDSGSKITSISTPFGSSSFETPLNKPFRSQAAFEEKFVLFVTSKWVFHA